MTSSCLGDVPGLRIERAKQINQYAPSTRRYGCLIPVTFFASEQFEHSKIEKTIEYLVLFQLVSLYILDVLLKQVNLLCLLNLLDLVA